MPLHFTSKDTFARRGATGACAHRRAVPGARAAGSSGAAQRCRDRARSAGPSRLTVWQREPELVQDRGLSYPAVRHHADAGLDNQLAFLDAALDWVAANTPRDRETRYLEAEVTAWHNDDPAQTEVLRSGVREGVR